MAVISRIVSAFACNILSDNNMDDVCVCEMGAKLRAYNFES